MLSISQKLRQSVLQAAFQGRLSKQLPEDGTGEDLYQQIQSENQVRNKAGKGKKETPFSEITDNEKPFDIPESWTWVKFLSVIDIATNLVQPFEYADYCHIAPDNIEKGTGKLLQCRTVAEDKVISVNHLFEKGQIIYSKIRPLLRKAVIAPFTGLCSADMYPLKTRLDSKYVLYFLLSDGFNLQIASAMSSRVKMPKINQEELSRVSLPLPPLLEQKRIVVKIEELLAQIDELEKIENELRTLHQTFPGDMKAALLQAAMQGRLTQQLPEDGDMSIKYNNLLCESDELVVPENWAIIRLRDVATHQNGKAFKPVDWIPKGMKIIRIQNLTDENAASNYCNAENVEEKYIINPGDVLVSWSCTIDSFIYHGERAALNQHIFRVYFDKVEILPEFYVFGIKSLLSTINKQRHGSTMTHITKTDYEQLCFPLPPLAEQQRIVDRLNQLLPLCDSLQSSL